MKDRDQAFTPCLRVHNAAFGGCANVPDGGMREWLLSCLTIYPVRCQLCTQRFLALLGRPSFNPSRDYERLLARSPVLFRQAFSGAPDAQAEGTVVNFSIRGCTIDSNVSVLQRRLPALAQSRDGLGVEFLSIRPGEEERLKRLIEIRLYSRPH